MDESVIKLVSQEYKKNEFGVPVLTPVYSDEIECVPQDITRSEFFGTGRRGLNDSFMVQIATCLYNGESMIEYNGETYSIYRSYKIPGTDYTELYIERKGGTNGQQESHD